MIFGISRQGADDGGDLPPQRRRLARHVRLARPLRGNGRRAEEAGLEESEVYFTRLFDACGIETPPDWRQRVLIGSDRKQSATARENLEAVEADLPDELPDTQKRLVDYAAPGLRELLGYGRR